MYLKWFKIVIAHYEINLHSDFLDVSWYYNENLSLDDHTVAVHYSKTKNTCFIIHLFCVEYYSRLLFLYL